MVEGPFLYKISDFGIGCQLGNNLIPEVDFNERMVEFKKIDKKKHLEILEQLYKEHKKLYRAYVRIKRQNEAKFHLDRALESVEKIIENNDIQKKKIFARTIFVGMLWEIGIDQWGI